MEPRTSAFTLPDRLAHKADPDALAEDEAHFAAIADSLEQAIAQLTDRLAAARRAPAGTGQQALERDLEVHRLSGRLRLLGRYDLDLCLGHVVAEDRGEPLYVGRLGLTGTDGRALLVDWRSPAAEPFFAATHAHRMGLLSRRRYRWSGGHVVDYWDEVFTEQGLTTHSALDDQSAFIAGLGAGRSDRMRDVLGTIAADQDAVIRAGSQGALVVDGGPGTGKTVVALHRTAYLLYSDPRLGHRRGGVLVVGPSDPYLAYVSDVLPSLGEEGVRTCTLRDLVPEGVGARPEPDPRVAGLKADARLVDAIDPAVALYEEPPKGPLEVVTPWGEVVLHPSDWAEAFDAPGPGTPHNDARDEVWEALLDIVLDRLGDDGVHEGGRDEFDAYGLGGEGRHTARRQALARHGDLTRALARAWPLLDPAELVGDLWSVPAYLRRCAPWLAADEVTALQREDASAWTVADLPLLDAARARLGDPEAPGRRRRRETADAAERARMSDVVDQLVATDDSDLGVMSMLRGQDLRAALAGHDAAAAGEADTLAAAFAHVVVDEAQELTDAEWRMVLRRCPSRSLTVVGDRTQARHGFTESWEERLARVGVDRVAVTALNVNYRTPREVMAVAEPVVRAAVPDANVPISVRDSGIPVRYGPVSELTDVVDEWLATTPEGVACVLGAPWFVPPPRVSSLPPELAKGLEFDLVVLVDPDRLGDGVQGAVDRYVAMTRATQRLVVLDG